MQVKPRSSLMRSTCGNMPRSILRLRLGYQTDSFSWILPNASKIFWSVALELARDQSNFQICTPPFASVAANISRCFELNAIPVTPGRLDAEEAKPLLPSLFAGDVLLGAGIWTHEIGPKFHVTKSILLVSENRNARLHINMANLSLRSLNWKNRQIPQTMSSQTLPEIQD